MREVDYIKISTPKRMYFGHIKYFVKSILFKLSISIKPNNNL